LNAQRDSVGAKYSWSNVCGFVVVVHFGCGCVFPNSLMSISSSSAFSARFFQ
jgi:hypothetical protein